jgi:hypothetical protein
MPVNNLMPWVGATSNSAGNTTGSFNPPKGLAATVRSDSIVGLKWLPSNENDQNAFMLMACRGGTCSSMDKDTVGNVLTYDWPGLSGDETTYCFYVAGWKNVCGGVTSAYYPRVDDMLYGGSGGLWTGLVPVTITNPQANFQTRLTVGYLAGMKNDFSDMRLYNATAKQEIPYWLENKSDGSLANIWFKTPSNTSDTINLYYGNSLAVAPNYSGSSIFEFFDGFDGTMLDASKWLSSAGSTVSVSGGRLTVGTGAVYSKNSISNFTTPLGMVFEMKNSWATTATGASGLTICNSQATYSGNATNQTAHADLRLAGTSGLQEIAGDGATPSWNVSTAYLNPNTGIPANSDVNIAGQDRIIGIEYQNSTNLNLYSKDPITYAVQYSPATTAFASVWNPSGPTAPYIYLGHIWGSNAGAAAIYPMSVDWVRVRKYSANPPVASLGTPGIRDGSENVCILTAKTMLTPPSNLQVNGGTGTGGYTSPYPYKIPLVWTDNSLVNSGYIIDRKVWNGQWVQRTVTGDANSFIDTEGIEPQKTYTYRIRSINSADNVQSPFSSELTVTTPAFTGGDDKATCICTGAGDSTVCQ